MTACRGRDFDSIADSAKNLSIGEEGIAAIVSALKNNEQLALVE